MTGSWKSGRDYSAAFGGLMIGLGMALGMLGSMMTDPVREQVPYTSASILTALCLLIVIFLLAIPESRAFPRYAVNVYLLAGAASAGCCLVYLLLQSSLTDVHLLGVLAALHGLFWGAWYMRLAFRFRSSSLKALVLCILAATTASMGIIVGTRSGLTMFGCITSVACYMLALGIQIFTTAAFLYREYAREQVFERRWDNAGLSAARYIAPVDTRLYH